MKSTRMIADNVSQWKRAADGSATADPRSTPRVSGPGQSISRPEAGHDGVIYNGAT